MPQHDRRSTRRPLGRTDSTRPGAQRGSDTHRATNTRSRTRAPAATPTPATVWPAGPDPIPATARWPLPIVKKILTAFSESGARVVLVPCPADTTHNQPVLVGPGGLISHAPADEPDAELAEALGAIDEAHRLGSVVHVDDPVPAPIGRPPGSRGDAEASTPNAPAQADLVLTSQPPSPDADHTAELVTAAAARLLRPGGIFAALTHCDWSRGELIDPTGPIVAASQHADLLYLQHIVALHAPVADGQFTPEPGALDTGATSAAQRAAVRELPAPHRRIHSDVLAFASTRTPSQTEAEATSETGALR